MKKWVLGIFLLTLTGGALFIWLGIYNIAATDKHWDITTQLLELLRERSIETRAENIVVPNLDDPVRIATAAVNYNTMCAICHSAPGRKPTELHEGLYPKPPVFSASDHDTHDKRSNFWVIKHGIKLTGMPSWGSHNDEEIWALVAFIDKLKGMSASEYQRLTATEKTQSDHRQTDLQDVH